MIEKNLYDIDGYTITSDGHIYSSNYNHTNNKKELIGYIDKDGYRVILIKCKQYPNGIKIRRCRAVAEHFIPNPNNLPQVNHKDTNRQNDSADNLEWCTNTYNQQYAEKCGSFDKYKHSVKQVLDDDVIAVYTSISEASRKTGIKRTGIIACLNGKQNKAGGYNWYD